MNERAPAEGPNKRKVTLHPHRKTPVARLAAALLLATALTGCQRQSAAELHAEARQHQQKGENSSAVIVLKNALEANPDDAEARHLLAQTYLDTGDAMTAEKEVRAALRLGHRAELSLPVLGRALLLQGQFQKVLDETEAAAVANSWPELLCVRADAYLALGKLDYARDLYDQVLKEHPKYGAALIGLGRLAYLNHDVELASKYAAQALVAEPRNTDALLFKGDLLRAQNQPEQALAAYDQVLAVSPSHRSAHVEKAYLAIGLNRFELAQAELDAARKATPGSLLVEYTQALLNFSQGKPAAAQESLLKVLRVAPDHMPSVLLAGAVNLNLGSLYIAEHHFRHYLEKNPDSVYARKMLASTLLRNGNSPEALSALAPALKGAQQDVQLLALAGESHMQVGDFDKASEFFGKASELDPKAANLRTSLGLSELGKGDSAQAVRNLQLATKLDLKSRQAGIALVRTELELKHVDNAFAAAQALVRAQPDSAAVHDVLGNVYMARNDAVQARASFRKALSLEPAYYPAAASLARLEVHEKNPAAARQHLQDFLGKNKTSADAMTALASMAVAEGKQDEATRLLEQASAVDPNVVAPAVNLIAQYLRAGQNEKALNLARKLQVTHPDNPDLLDLLGKSQLANGEQLEALATYKQLVAALPRSAQALMQVAALELLLKNATAAEDYLKAVLAMQPDFPAAQLALAELYVRKGWNELALMIADRLQRNYPGAAAGYQLAADVLMGQNKAAQALPAYEKALGLHKTNELLIKTANALRMAGKKDEAARRLGQWMAQHPADLRVELYRAETLLADKQFDAAARQLESILQRSPQNVAALNNLALTYQQLQDPRAEEVAQLAYKGADKDPVVMDTLGWILVEKGDNARGLAILQQANALAPQARDIRYHMAAALYKAGNKAAARKELELLAAGNMRFAQAEDAQALLKQLQ
jgi:putative PEP-CTERM system TPR-repeat lipoprotein